VLTLRDVHGVANILFDRRVYAFRYRLWPDLDGWIGTALLPHGSQTKQLSVKCRIPPSPLM
jgi:hypothetical protein